MNDCSPPLVVGSVWEYDVVESTHKPGRTCAKNLRRLDPLSEEKDAAWASRDAEQPAVKFGEPNWTIKLASREGE